MVERLARSMPFASKEPGTALGAESQVLFMAANGSPRTSASISRPQAPGQQSERGPKTEDYWGALGIAIAVVVTAAIATVPYLIWADTRDASMVSGVLLMATIGLTGFASARNAGADRRCSRR